MKSSLDRYRSHQVPGVALFLVVAASYLALDQFVMVLNDPVELPIMGGGPAALAATMFKITVDTGGGLAKVELTGDPWADAVAFNQALNEVELEYVVQWDEGPLDDEDGHLYYEAEPRQ